MDWAGDHSPPGGLWRGGTPTRRRGRCRPDPGSLWPNRIPARPNRLLGEEGGWCPANQVKAMAVGALPGAAPANAVQAMASVTRHQVPELRDPAPIERSHQVGVSPDGYCVERGSYPHTGRRELQLPIPHETGAPAPPTIRRRPPAKGAPDSSAPPAGWPDGREPTTTPQMKRRGSRGKGGESPTPMGERANPSGPGSFSGFNGRMGPSPSCLAAPWNPIARWATSQSTAALAPNQLERRLPNAGEPRAWQQPPNGPSNR